MADTTQVLTVLERQRQALVDAYINRAWTMWQSLDPADWWNDAVTQGVGAWITQNQMAFVKAMRRLGISYADIMLGLVNVPADGQIPEYVVTRDNTDPWAVSVRPADAYRDLAVRDPTIRPLAWEGLDDATRNAVDSWLTAAQTRLESNANTDGQIAMNGAATERFHGSGIKRYRRVIHPELSKTGSCGLCVVASNNVYSTADLIPMHNNCFPAWVPVESPTGTYAVDSRPYRGILVDIQAGGRNFSVTPNHPILTTRGWVPAQFLKQGDDLIRYGNDIPRMFLDGPHNKYNETPIGKVFHSFTENPSVISSSMPVTAEDFHGDGVFNTNVEIVSANCLLGIDGKPTRCNLPSESKLLLGGGSQPLLASKSNLVHRLLRLVASTRSPIRCGSQSAFLFSGQPAHPNGGGFIPRTRTNTNLLEPPIYDIPTDAISSAEFLNGLAGMIQTEKIVKVGTRFWSGQVYNLQTNGGWFTASGFIVHNCKCTVAPITAGNDPGMRLNDEDLQAIYRKAGNTTSAAGLKSVRVEVVSHSEIGPILTQSQWRREYDDGTPAPEWKRPDLNMTRRALARMYDRARVFQTHYRKVMDTGAEDRFKFEGRYYRFKPSSHLQQAMSYQTAWLQYLRSTLGLAA